MLLSTFPALAASPRSVDVRTLDVASVRTGMDYDEATRALTEHFQAAPGDIEPDPFQGENIVTHMKLPSTLTYEKDGTRVTVHFEGRVPVDPALPMQWCVRPSTNTGIGCPADDARLDLSQVQLMLTDPAWQQARIRFIQGQQAIQPRL